MENKIKVTCEIPAPPDGWVYDGWRVPNVTDQVLGSFWKPWDREGYRCHCAVKAPADDLPEGWTRDGDWILAPIEWVDFPQILWHGMEDYPAELGDLVCNKNYRCVGFVEVVDPQGVWCDADIRPYSILGNWRATHAALLEDE